MTLDIYKDCHHCHAFPLYVKVKLQLSGVMTDANGACDDSNISKTVSSSVRFAINFDNYESSLSQMIFCVTSRGLKHLPKMYFA